jgi:glucose-6-phosphate isomerase
MHLDIDNLLEARAPGHGIEPEGIEHLRARVRGFHARIEMERRRGEHAYLELPGDDAMLEQVLRVAAPHMGQFTSLVVLGIGGSALGLRALHRALVPRDIGPPLFIIDNTDPSLYRDTQANIDIRRALFVAVSKSGGTLESVIALGHWVDRLRQAGCDLSRQLLVVTDPERGPLRRFCDRLGLETAPIPAAVGGRFSVLSAAGLLPAALLGIDVGALLAGAQGVIGLLKEGREDDDWPARLGLLATDLCRKRGKRCLVFMPYSSRLENVADWFVQLWDESLGKQRRTDGTAIEAGQTAVKAVGATDQHAQMQLFLDGPNDKVVVFARVERHEPDVAVGDFEWDDFDVGFIAGKTLGQVINAQQEGAAQALAQRARPNCVLRLPHLDASSLGALLQGLELATTYAGFAWGVNPYDQPAVELGKGLSRRILAGS